MTVGGEWKYGRGLGWNASARGVKITGHVTRKGTIMRETAGSWVTRIEGKTYLVSKKYCTRREIGNGAWEFTIPAWLWLKMEPQ